MSFPVTCCACDRSFLAPAHPFFAVGNTCPACGAVDNCRFPATGRVPLNDPVLQATIAERAREARAALMNEWMARVLL